MSTLPKYERSNTIVRLRTRYPIRLHNTLYITLPYEYCKAYGIDEFMRICLLWDKDTKQLVVYKCANQELTIFDKVKLPKDD